MLGNKKKTIGVFMSNITDDFQDTLCKGIITKARELDYNVAFFTNFGGYNNNAYDLGEFHISDLPNYEELDGVILTPDLMLLRNLLPQYRTFLKNKGNCPVVSVRKEIEEYYNVLVDNHTILEEIIRHFIEIHGFTRINFLAGPKGIPDSDKRLEAYKRILTEHHIPVEDKRIYYGNFYKAKCSAALDYWLNGTDELPQAIICANDFMAFTVCRELNDRGIEVPDQIAVTGCDDVADASDFRPSLTTARVPVFEMGMEAVIKIDKHNRGIEQPRNTILNTSTVYRASCGCKRHWYRESSEHRRNHVIERETLQNEISYNAYMSADLAGLSKLEDIMNTLRGYIRMNENVSRFFLCLYRDWDYYHDNGDESHSVDDNELMMELGFKDNEIFTKMKFSNKELIPPVLAEEEPVFYYFAMLHHQEHCFGYIGISFSKIQTYMKAFQTWMINLSNALENVRIHGELNRLVYKLEDMSIRDELTQLYNRRVIETLGKQYLNHCLEECTRLMVFTTDMDKLKYINDRFGHAYGDAAIKVVANALFDASDDDEICIRLGGDEFMAIGMDYDEAKMNKFVNRFINEINKCNLMKQYDFSIYVSYGYTMQLPDENTTIEGCLVEADTLMYQQKYEKEALKMKANLIC